MKKDETCGSVLFQLVAAVGTCMTELGMFVRVPGDEAGTTTTMRQAAAFMLMGCWPPKTVLPDESLRVHEKYSWDRADETKAAE